MHRTLARLLPLVAPLLLSTAAAAQVTLHGRVVDAATGEPLPAANLQLVGTFRGTITNEDGRYELPVDSLPARLRVRYIGYEVQERTIAPGSPPEQHFRLQPVAYELEEFVVTGEDPGMRIMRRVIERKQLWRADLRTFAAEAYTRLRLANDTSIVLLEETASTLYWDRDEGPREVVRSRRRTKNLQSPFSLAAASETPNFYDDNVEVFGFDVIGPTHPHALDHYDFRLVGYRQLDGRRVFEISVNPSGRLQPTFVGTVWVLDDVYALLEVDLKPGASILFPPPIERFDAHYRQQFSNFGTDVWLPVDVRVEGELKVGIPGLAFPTMKIGRVSRLTDYALNVALPDSLYRSDDVLRVDSAAVAADTTFARAAAVIPLTTEEQQAYERIDSTATMARAFRPTGFLARYVRIEEDGDGDAPRQRRGPLSGLDVTPELWYNRVEAAHLGGAVALRPVRAFRLEGRLAYETGREAWSYGGQAEAAFGRRGAGTLALAYHRGVDTRYGSAVHGRATNSLFLLLGRPDYFDYFENDRLRLSAGFEFRRLGAAVEARLNAERHRSLAATTDFRLIGPAEQRPNPAVRGGALRSVGLHLRLGEEGAPLGVVGYRGLVLDVEHAPTGFLENAFDFTRLSVQADWRIETFLRRRLLPNTLDVRVVAATAAGALPPQRFSVLDAAVGFFTPYGAFRTAEGRPYEGGRTLALFWEHNFRTVPFELLGLDRLARRGYSVLLHGGHGRTWAPPACDCPGGFAPALLPGVHHEAGVSVNGLFGLLRLDLTARLDAPGFRVGVAPARLF